MTSVPSAAELVDNRYYDGVHYDLRYAGYTHDIDFWCRQAEQYGPEVLELATGTGRIAFPMAATGAKVTGLDISASMLEQARSKSVTGPAPAFVDADMRTFALGRTFDLITVPCSSICHLLTDTDVAQCLTRVREHAHGRTVFGLDLVNPHPARLARADDVWRPRFSYPEPDGSGEVVVTGRQRYDEGERLLVDELEYHFTGTGAVEQVTRLSRMHTADEMAALLAAHGFAPVQRWGGFEGEPFEPDSASQVWICRVTPGAA